MKHYKKPLIWAYVFLRRRVFGGLGLSRIALLRDITLIIEKFLRGEVPDMVIKRGQTIYLDHNPAGALAESLHAFEPTETEFIESVLKRGGTFADIGANIGWYTLFAARKVGATGKVFAFEPDERNLALLARNVRANHYHNVIIVPKAVSDVTGTRKIYMRKKSWTGNSFYDPRQAPEKFIWPHTGDADIERYVKAVEVPTVSLDDYFGDRPLDVVKMDVEGAEELVVKGMPNLLKNNRNIIVVAEFCPGNLAATGDDAREFLDIFVGLGFSIFDIDEVREKIVPRTVKDLLRMYALQKLNGTNLIFRKA